jgi:hypothetical protein
MSLSLIAAGFLTTTAEGGGPSDTSRQRVLIRVYDNAGVPPSHRARAISHSRKILDRAGVRLSWLDCPAPHYGTPDTRCATPRSALDLVVRLANLPAEDTSTSFTSLGYSMINHETHNASFATIFVNRVNDLADHARVDRVTLLARAVAHEIGHLILATNKHSDEGILREVWTVEQLARNRASDWLFLPVESERLRYVRMLADRAHVLEMADSRRNSRSR